MQQYLLIVVGLLALMLPSWAATAKKSAKKSGSSTKVTSVQKKSATAPKSAKTAAVKPPSSKVRKTAATRRPSSRRSRYNPWSTPTFADSTWGDSVDGEDLVVRRAAVEALGPYNGAVVVADPNTGRILTIVNQKLAVTGAYQPCSTIKLVAGVAAVNEGLIDRDTPVRLSRRSSMTLTTAIAKSNNPYFANLGNRLGFEKVDHYARQLGLGEKAVLNLAGESAGTFPDAQPKGMTVGLMTSFGEAIALTPLQLTAMVSAIANGGTLYWLQYPRTPDDIQAFEPKVKRYLEIQQAIPELKPGMMGTVGFGTGRRAFYDMNEPILGKTGTCSDLNAHLGWFGSFNEVSGRKLVVTVLLTGGRHVNGPVAAGVAGQVYRTLSQQQYFAHQTSYPVPVAAFEATVANSGGASPER